MPLRSDSAQKEERAWARIAWAASVIWMNRLLTQGLTHAPVMHEKKCLSPWTPSRPAAATAEQQQQITHCNNQRRLSRHAPKRPHEAHENLPFAPHVHLQTLTISRSQASRPRPAAIQLNTYTIVFRSRKVFRESDCELHRNQRDLNMDIESS